MRSVALVIFSITYLLLAIGRLRPFRLDRTGIAIIGAAAMILTGVVPLPRAAEAVDYRTLVLLFGMMIVVANLRLSGFFRLVTARVTSLARSPVQLLGATVAISGVLAAFFINDVVCLVLAPLLLHLTRTLRLSPVPFLLALATASNIGSVATITGNPQNMLVASFSGIHYRTFAWHLAPVGCSRLARRFRTSLEVLSDRAAQLAAIGRVRSHHPCPSAVADQVEPRRTDRRRALRRRLPGQ